MSRRPLEGAKGENVEPKADLPEMLANVALYVLQRIVVFCAAGPHAAEYGSALQFQPSFRSVPLESVQPKGRPDEMHPRWR